MRICSVPECGKKHHSKGYCRNHAYIYNKRGYIPLKTKISKNEYIYVGGYYEIILCNPYGEEVSRTKVDEIDIGLLSKYKWHMDNHGYAKTGHKKSTPIRLQNLIIEHDPEMLVDHVNGDKLDNRRENLRVCTRQQNCWNSKKSERALSSKYKGVSLCRSDLKWVSSICLNGIPVTIGRYATEEEAAREYDSKAKELFGEFAKLNFKGEEDEVRKG